MNWWHILLDIPAAVTASVMLVNILPFSLSAKLNPWVMFACALLVLALPLPVVVALAIAVPMGLIYGWTGVRLQGHEPVKLPVRQIISIKDAVINRLSIIREPEETIEILTQEFPNPATPKYVPEL